MKKYLRLFLFGIASFSAINSIGKVSTPPSKCVLGDIKRSEPLFTEDDPFAIELSIANSNQISRLWSTNDVMWVLLSKLCGYTNNNDYASVIKRLNHISDYAFDNRMLIELMEQHMTNYFNSAFNDKVNGNSNNFVSKSGDELINGNKTFKNTLTVQGNTGKSIRLNDDGSITLFTDSKRINLYNSSGYLCCKNINEIPSDDSSDKLVTTEWINNYTENNLVHKIGNETINGQKTFNGNTTLNGSTTINYSSNTILTLVNGSNQSTNNIILKNDNNYLSLNKSPSKNDNSDKVATTKFTKENIEDLIKRIKALESSMSGVSIVPIGTILATAVTNVPNDYLLCDGSMFNTNEYSELYIMIGTNVVPNLTGRFLRGAGNPSLDYDACDIRQYVSEGLPIPTLEKDIKITVKVSTAKSSGSGASVHQGSKDWNSSIWADVKVDTSKLSIKNDSIYKRNQKHVTPASYSVYYIIKAK